MSTPKLPEPPTPAQYESEVLKEVLKDALQECELHNKDYHHVTCKAKLDKWRELISSATEGSQ